MSTNIITWLTIIKLLLLKLSSSSESTPIDSSCPLKRQLSRPSGVIAVPNSLQLNKNKINFIHAEIILGQFLFHSCWEYTKSNTREPTEMLGKLISSQEDRPSWPCQQSIHECCNLKMSWTLIKKERFLILNVSGTLWATT